MKQLTIDTGVQEFEINGSGVLRFNPSDPNVYNRFFAAETTLTELDAVVKQSVSATLEGSSDFNFSTGRCAVRVYERYSAIGNGRVTMSLTLLEADGQIRLSAITSGGSQAVFFKVNTLGAESFLNTIRDTVERFAPGAH